MVQWMDLQCELETAYVCQRVSEIPSPRPATSFPLRDPFRPQNRCAYNLGAIDGAWLPAERG